jgi:hypothetical protein
MTKTRVKRSHMLRVAAIVGTSIAFLLSGVGARKLHAQANYWAPISLPTAYFYPSAQPSDPDQPSVNPPYLYYFPPGAVQWFWEPDCSVWRNSSKRNISGELYGVTGIDFVGNWIVTNPGCGGDSGCEQTDVMAFYLNSNQYCYDGGYEYGLYVRLLDGHLIFYQEANANIGGAVSSGVDLSADYAIDASKYREYRVSVLQPNGDFRVEVILTDPSYCYDPPCSNFSLDIPVSSSFMPNLYSATGYLTAGVNHDSNVDHGTQTAYFHLTSVNIGQ